MGIEVELDDVEEFGEDDEVRVVSGKWKWWCVGRL